MGYKEFLKSGAWPDKTTFVVEERGAQTKGSVNKHGNFQTDLMGIGVEVKDASLPDKWAYYDFGDNKTASANPRTPASHVMRKMPQSSTRSCSLVQRGNLSRRSLEHIERLLKT